MSADLTREQAREQIARAIFKCVEEDMWPTGWDGACDHTQDYCLDLAREALTVLWPVVESLRAELAHAHTIIARHVEPRREGES